MTRNSMKASIIDMLQVQAVELLAEYGELPDELLAPGEVSRAQTRRLLKSKQAREERSAWLAELEQAFDERVAAATSDYERKRDQVVWQLAVDAAQHSLAMPLGSRHIPRDLRQWARTTLKKHDQDAAVRVYVYLVLRDVLDWENAHLPEAEDRSGLGRAQAAYVKQVQADSGRQVTFVDDEGVTVTLDNVSDSPASGADVRGWDRATSYARRVAKAPPKKEEQKFYSDFQDRKGRVFTLSHRGWSYNQQRVATEVSQRLEQRLTKGLLKRVS